MIRLAKGEAPIIHRTGPEWHFKEFRNCLTGTDWALC